MHKRCIIVKRKNSIGENRCRFPLMVLKRIREMVGNDLALEVRLSGEEYVPEGLHIEDVVT